MIATSHVIIGGAVGLIVGSTTDSFTAAFVAGIVSHLVCDFIPHWDHPEAPRLPSGDLQFTKKVYIFAITDSLVAFFLTLFIWINFHSFPDITYYPLGALGGYLPDFADNIPLWRFQIRNFPGFKQFHKLHEAIHLVWMGRFPMPEYRVLGTVTQLALVIPSLYYLLK